MKIENILFDLDGTLTDPGLGITNSVWYALKLRGIEVASREELFRFIGPPLLNSYMQYYGLEEEDARQAITDFRVYFEESGIFENEIYEGIPEMLKTLTEAGKRVYLATSKPEKYARMILDHFDITKYFTFICGNTMAEDRSRKEDVIAYIREACPEVRADNSVMVGDRIYDIEGGRAHGMQTVGVTFGYAAKGELESSGATCIAHTVAELTEILMK
jgi:phosphoglycolate phosphatase